jgi:DNA-binding transcriptional ArsR family regulator
VKFEAPDWFRDKDFSFIAAVALMVPDIGHAGKLFADREVHGLEWIGHLLAGCVDAVFMIAFRKAAKAKQLPRRIYAVSVAVMACTVNGAFNVAYYRSNYAADPFWVSLTLGASAPVLAALLSILQAFDKVERLEQEQVKMEADRADEMEKFRIAQAEETKRQIALEAEKTKQERAKTRVEKARIEAERLRIEAERVEKAAKQRQRGDELTRKLAELGKSGEILTPFLDNPMLTHSAAAQILGVTRQVVSYHLGKLENAGVIERNGNGVRLKRQADSEED